MVANVGSFFLQESVALQQAVVTNMPKPSSQHQTLHNRRYPDFWRRRKNQIVAGVLITGFTLIVLVGLIYLIRNGTSYKVTYTGYNFKNLKLPTSHT